MKAPVTVISTATVMWMAVMSHNSRVPLAASGVEPKFPLLTNIQLLA
jgi:hypothetical protein